MAYSKLAAILGIMVKRLSNHWNQIAASWQTPRGRTTLIRCIVAAIAGVAVEFGLLTLFVSRLHLFYVAGALLAGSVYVVINFLLNRRWTFQANHMRAWPQLLRYGAVTGFGMALGTTLMWLLVRGTGLPYQVGWAIAGVVSFTAWTFPMHRQFTYRGGLALEPVRSVPGGPGRTTTARAGEISTFRRDVDYSLS